MRDPVSASVALEAARSLCVPALTVEDATAIVDVLRQYGNVDDEAAHDVEDRLRAAVLEAVATGPVLESDDDTYRELCRIALSTRDIEFSRWCA